MICLQSVIMSFTVCKCDWIWQNLASTHIQFYNFEGPQLYAKKCYHAQILVGSFMKIWKESVKV